MDDTLSQLVLVLGPVAIGAILALGGVYVRARFRERRRGDGSTEE